MDFTAFVLDNEPQDIDAPIFVDAEQPDRVISWRGYAASIKKVAVGLRELGLVKGECVALLSPADIYYYVLGNGVVAAGGVFAPISPSGTRSELAKRLASADAKWIFAAPEVLEDVIAAAEAVGVPSSQILLFDAALRVSDASRKCFSSLLRSNGTARGLNDCTKSSGDRTCYRFLTSGSTGSPKEVDISHKALIARCQYSLRAKKEHRVKTLQFIDFHHVTASAACNSGALGFQTVYCSRQNSAISVIDNVSKYGIENVFLYPKVMAEMVDAIQRGARDGSLLASLRTVACGGSAAPASSLKAFEALLPVYTKLRSSYGTTEIFSMTALPPHVPLVPGFVGCYAPGVEVLIIDPDTGEDVGPDVNGEICVRGPMVFEKYFQNEAATKAAFLNNSEGRWFRTGDKGHFSSSVQQLAVTGRYKDVFVVGSEKVSPNEVEETLLQHEAIADVVVTPTPDHEHEGLYKPLAYVVAPDPALAAQDVVDFAAEHLSSFKIPTGGVMFCDKIPRTEGLQKVVRKALEDVEHQSRSAMNLTVSQ